MFIFLENLTEIAALIVAQLKGNIRNAVLRKIQVLTGQRNLLHVDVVHHADMVLLLKDAAQIHLTDRALMHDGIQADILMDMGIHIGKHTLHNRIALNAALAQAEIHEPEQPVFQRHAIMQAGGIQMEVIIKLFQGDTIAGKAMTSCRPSTIRVSSFCKRAVSAPEIR